MATASLSHAQPREIEVPERSAISTSSISLQAALRSDSLSDAQASNRGRPEEQLQVEESGENEIEYPTGPQLWLNMISVLLICFLNGLDLAIVAVTVPSLTNQFKTLDDIGWYSAVYGLIFSATNFFFGKMFTVFGLKQLYMISVMIFELGSIVCTFAPSSKMFILGRAIAGFGAAGQGAGGFVIVSRCFPNHKRPIVTGLLGGAQALGLVSAPIIGGALVDALTWRACFGINVPIGVVAVIITAFCMHDPFPNPDRKLPVQEKLKRIDPVGTLIIVPCLICFMLALQWGGTRYGWSNWRILLLFGTFAVMAAVFAFIQHRQGDKATLPPKILKNRTVLASALFNCCTNGLLAVTEYYLSIYFQGVKGYPATKAGLLGLPMLVGMAASSMVAAFGVSKIGYYTPFLFATGILAPIASGILTTIDLDDTPVKAAAFLGFVGVAVGFGGNSPITAVMTVIPQKDVSIALGVLGFGGGMGSALFVATAAALFQSRLRAEILKRDPSENITSISTAGLADIRKVVGPDRLGDVLSGYSEAVVQTLYIPLSLALLTLVGAVFTEIRSVKKKAA